MISEDLVLDASGAEATIAQIDTQLQQTAELFKVALADALDLLTQPITASVDADVDPARAEIAALVSDPVPIEVPVQGDTSPALTSIDDLRQIADSVPIDIAVDADTSGAQEQVQDLGGSSSTASGHVHELDGSLAALSVTAGITEGSAKELVSTFGELGGEGAKGAAVGIATIAASTAGFFEEGLKAVSAGQRFNLVLGTMAEEAEHIDINGLNTSLKELGVRFGSTESDMENVTAKLVQFSVNSGASKEQAIEFAHQIETLSARAISLNPQLGDLATVTDNLGLKIGRGGRFAANYGLDLNAAEIATRALTDTGKTEASQLTFVEKAMAGAEIASEKYGGTLATTVAEGEKNAAIQAESLKARFEEAIEQLGVPVVAPVFDILEAAEPIAVDVAKILSEISKDVLPAVAVALALVGPPLQLVADVLGLIPGPVVAAAAGFVLFTTALTGMAEAAGLSEAALVTIAPEIGLLAAGLAVAAGVVSYFSGQESGAAVAADDLTKALEDQTLKAQENIDALEAKRLSDNKSANAAHDAGVGYSLMNTAIQHGTDDFGGYVRAIDRVDDTIAGNSDLRKQLHDDLVAAGAGGTEFGRSLLNLVDTSKLSGEELLTYVQTIERLHNEYIASGTAAAHEIDAASELGGVVEETAASVAALTAADEGLVSLVDDLASSMRDAYESGLLHTDQLIDYNAALDDLVTTLSGDPDKVKDLQGSLADANDRVADTAQSVADAEAHLAEVRSKGKATDIAKAERSLADARRAHEKAIAGVSSAQGKLNDALEDGVFNLDISTEKGRENVKALEDAGRSIEELAIQRFKDTGNVQDGIAAAEEYTEQLREQLRQAGYTEEQIQEMIDTINLTPGDIATTFSNNSVDQQLLVQKYLTLLDEIPDKQQIRIETFIDLGQLREAKTLLDYLSGNYEEVDLTIRVNPGQARASGGDIQPWEMYRVGERGPEWFMSDIPGQIYPHGRTPVMQSNGASQTSTSILERDDSRGAIMVDGPLVGQVVSPSVEETPIAIARGLKGAMFRMGKG